MFSSSVLPHSMSTKQRKAEENASVVLTAAHARANANAAIAAAKKKAKTTSSTDKHNKNGVDLDPRHFYILYHLRLLLDSRNDCNLQHICVALCSSRDHYPILFLHHSVHFCTSNCVGKKEIRIALIYRIYRINTPGQ